MESEGLAAPSPIESSPANAAMLLPSLRFGRLKTKKIPLKLRFGGIFLFQAAAWLRLIVESEAIELI